MKPNYVPSVIFSVLAHIGLVALVVFGSYLTSLLFKEEKKKPTPKYINATLFDINTKTTEVSPNDLAKQEPDPVEKPPEDKPEPEPETPDKPDQEAVVKKQQEELKKQQELQQQKVEEQKQQEQKKKQQQEADRQAKIKQQKDAEQAKLKAEKAKAEKVAKAKADAEARKKAEAKKAADAKKKAAVEAQAKKEAQKKALQEKLKQSQKNSLADKLRAEQAAQASQSYIGEIEQQIRRKWSRPAGAQTGLVATLEIRFVPSGEVRSVAVISSSGDPKFDDSAVRAVKKAAPIAVIKQIPTDVFDANFRSLKVRFNPW